MTLGVTPDEKASAQQTDYNSRDLNRLQPRKTSEETGRRWGTWGALNDVVLG